ncbi:MAG: winged helix-turn-helix domain-containing protein [Bauldia sp.]|nr:winged helix-turn-helix domain-containing protein [Bauldia sp.]
MLYRFDGFEIDTEKYELRHDGVPRPVEPLVFDLIAFLSRNAGRVLSREEVIDGVWNGRIVSDATVASCVKSARKALDDSGDDQRYIRTVRARGFQFLAPVSIQDPAESTGAPPPPETTQSGANGAAMPGPEPAPASAAANGVPATPVANHGKKPRLAVLPFENLSAEGDEYFADGLTEDIITNLARFRDLLVIARSTTFHLKDRRIVPIELATELGVGFIVQGSVRRAAGRVRISVQLVDATSGLHLWAERSTGISATSSSSRTTSPGRSPRSSG